jgi:hypothetical protein
VKQADVSEGAVAHIYVVPTEIDVVEPQAEIEIPLGSQDVPDGRAHDSLPINVNQHSQGISVQSPEM